MPVLGGVAFMETHSHAVPEFGPMIERKHVLRAARTQCPALTLICAPSGYGKSVVATQLARQAAADHTWWVPVYDADVRDDEWIRLIVEFLGEGALRDRTDIPAAYTVGRDSAADWVLRFRSQLCVIRGTRVCVVLDGVSRLDGLERLQEVAALIRRETSSESMLIVTCRSVGDQHSIPDPTSVWLIAAADLRFNELEIAELAASAAAELDPQIEVARILERFGGHPALSALMMRHSRIDDQIAPPGDLVWHTRRLVRQMPTDVLPTMYCASLLREGTAAELDYCLCGSTGERGRWDAALSAAPLMNVVTDGGHAPIAFRMHAVLCDVLLTSPIAHSEAGATIRSRTVDYLGNVRDYARLQQLLLTAASEDEVAACCESLGTALLCHGGPGAVERCLSRVSPGRLSGSASLLLLRAAVLREREHIEEASQHASLASRAAEIGGEPRIRAAAILLGVRLALDSGDLAHARMELQGLSGSASQVLDSHEACLADAYEAALAAYGGDAATARRSAAAASNVLNSLSTSSREVMWAANCLAGVHGQFLGSWDECRTLLAAAGARRGMSPVLQLQCRANEAVALLELGFVREATKLARSVQTQADEAGASVLAGYVLCTLSDALWVDRPRESAELYERSQRLLLAQGDSPAIGSEQALRSMLLRADGALDEALTLAESGVARLREGGDSLLILRIQAEIEVAACLLALGDPWGARRVANGVAVRIAGLGAQQHELLLAMLLAEIDREDGDWDSAVLRLRGCAEYIAKGCSSWRMAMYVRAFPAILAVLVAAVGAASLPLRMLRLIRMETIEAALDCSGGRLSESNCAIVRSRAANHVTEGHREQRAEPDLHHPCTVRTFGGLEVTTPAGIVEDSRWRKRKARLLFAMLVSRRGQDLPRDIVIERLWPDMDEERAKRNFYVTWSTMKRALACGGTPEISSPFVQCVGGVCRVTRLVRSDLEDFDATVNRIRGLDPSRDALEAVRLARELRSIYRGEFLPGDVYEEWFAEIRDRAKHDFCDAMMISARFAESLDDYTEALACLRHAGAADPWREDIYQSTMRCQMRSGQRSGAIETYLSCRAKLVDDLGIDPSVETTRLYQAVLAMEDATLVAEDLQPIAQ